MAGHTSANSLSQHVLDDVGRLPCVSVIIPCHNAARTLDSCIQSALDQDFPGVIEICVYDDHSEDHSLELLRGWESRLLANANRKLRVTTSAQRGWDRAFGPSFARNRAAESSSGRYLCILDSDDEMLPHRISSQLAVVKSTPNALVGGGFFRVPDGSTASYTEWANCISDDDLLLQQWRECTIIQPTWFLSRASFDRIGGWDETLPPALLSDVTETPRRFPSLLDSPPSRIIGELLDTYVHKAFPEDTLFYHRHLHAGGTLARVHGPVLMYRYAEGSETWKMPRQMLQRVRTALFEERVLFNPTCAPDWAHFTIWGAGRDGKAFYNALSLEGRCKVKSFCDIDPKKIGQVYPIPVRVAKGSGTTAKIGEKALRSDAEADTPTPDSDCVHCKRPRLEGDACVHAVVSSPLPVPKPLKITSFLEAEPPIVCCVALGSKGGELQSNVAKLKVEEGHNFWYFV